MRLVSIKSNALSKYEVDPEFLKKSGRPCVLIVQLKYNGQRYNFAVPLRSNIPASSPKAEYFALPPRSTTQSGNRHGIHYIKMFPVLRSETTIYRVAGNKQAMLIKSIIDKNEKQIVNECQAYLNSYSKETKSLYATDIDLLLEVVKVTQNKLATNNSK